MKNSSNGNDLKHLARLHRKRKKRDTWAVRKRKKLLKPKPRFKNMGLDNE